MAMNYGQYIVRDHAICGGGAVVKGTRVYGAHRSGKLC